MFFSQKSLYRKEVFDILDTFFLGLNLLHQVLSTEYILSLCYINFVDAL